MILDHLLDVFRGSSLYQKELCIIISHVLLGAGGRGCVEGRGEVSCDLESFLIFCSGNCYTCCIEYQYFDTMSERFSPWFSMHLPPSLFLLSPVSLHMVSLQRSCSL